MVEQFVLLHSNYLEEVALGQHDSLGELSPFDKYKKKIAAIQALCDAALAHPYKEPTPHNGGAKKSPSMRHRKTKKKHRQNR